MQVMLHLFKRGEFVKLYELPDEIELPLRVSIVVYGNYLMTGDHKDLSHNRWVFVRVDDSNYEFDHVEGI